MQEDIDFIISATKESMDESIIHLGGELIKVRTGKASPAMLGGLLVPYYGSETPLTQVANISTADARTLIIQPWEKAMLAPIEKSIFEANLGITPMNDGEIIRITVPPLTEERRIDLVKRAKSLGEDAKVSIRSGRRDGMEGIKDAVKDGYPEDAGKRREDEVQKLTDSYTAKIDAMLKAKEEDIMTI